MSCSISGRISLPHGRFPKGIRQVFAASVRVPREPPAETAKGHMKKIEERERNDPTEGFCYRRDPGSVVRFCATGAAPARAQPPANAEALKAFRRARAEGAARQRRGNAGPTSSSSSSPRKRSVARPRHIGGEELSHAEPHRTTAVAAAARRRQRPRLRQLPHRRLALQGVPQRRTARSRCVRRRRQPLHHPDQPDLHHLPRLCGAGDRPDVSARVPAHDQLWPSRAAAQRPY